jgi:hypothetical protein
MATEEKKWWQLKRIWAGFWVIIFLIAFGIVQPILWLLADVDPPADVISLSTLLTIVVALFALGLTGFSILIYDYLREYVTARITKDIKRTGEEVHRRIKEDVDKLRRTEEEVHTRIKENVIEISKREEELSKRTEEEIKNNQTLFMVRVQRNMGYIFWRLFEVEEKKENSRSASVSKALIRLAIERAKTSLDFAEELPMNKKYKEETYKCRTNWMYFLAEAARIKSPDVTNQDKEQALKFVNEILAEVSEQDYPDYYEYQESCAWALEHLSEEEDKNLKQKAIDIIHELLKDASIPYAWREEIKEKWAPFLEEIKKKSDTANL